MLPCTSLVYSLGALCSFFIYILLFTDSKKKKKIGLCSGSGAGDSQWKIALHGGVSSI